MFEVRHVAQTASTNDDALALLGSANAAGAVIWADHQTAGRGRKGRAWVTPPGSGLLFTAILPEPVAHDALAAVTFWAALAVARGIEDALGVRLDLQWPNDVLLHGRKCAGILCVSRSNGGRAWVGCGVGLNVRRPNDASPAEVAPPPAFLSDATAVASRRALLDAILAACAAALPLLRRPADVLRAWENRAGLDGTAYRLHVDGEPEPLVATARRLANDGALVVHDPTGGERRIALADARVLRA